MRPPEEWPEYRDWLQAQQKELWERPLSANAADQHELARWEGEGGAVAADQPDETVIIVEPGDWQTKVDEVVDGLRRHGFDGAADEIVRHLPPQPKLDAEDRALEKRDMGELAFSRKEGADEREAVAWLLQYLKEIQSELAGEHSDAAGTRQDAPTQHAKRAGDSSDGGSTTKDKQAAKPKGKPGPKGPSKEQIEEWQELQRDWLKYCEYCERQGPPKRPLQDDEWQRWRCDTENRCESDPGLTLSDAKQRRKDFTNHVKRNPNDAVSWGNSGDAV